MTEQLFDVVAVSLETNKVLWVMRGKTEAAAEGAVKMAVVRQGVDDRFFFVSKAGSYNEGDEYKGADL